MYINQYHARLLERKLKGQIFTKPSLTVPDQSLSLRDIMRKYEAGEELPLAHPVHFDIEPNLDFYDQTRDGDYDLSDMLSDMQTQQETQVSANQDEVEPNPTEPRGSEADEQIKED